MPTFSSSKGRDTDYSLDVIRGRIPGHTQISVWGHDETLSTTRITVHPTGTTANISQSAIDATPATVKISSTSTADASPSGTGMRTMLLSGLDSSGVEQSETITMTGQTEVVSSLTYSAVTGMRGLSWGTGTTNAGTIWVGSGTVTTGVPAVKMFAMEIAFNKGMTAYYVVPASKTLYLRQLIYTVSTTNKSVEVYIETSDNGVNWITEGVFGMETSEFQGQIKEIPGLVAGTHLRLEALGAQAGTDLTMVISGELIDD